MILESLGLTSTPRSRKVKAIPEMDAFAKKRKVKEDRSEAELSQASASISDAMKAVTTMIATREPQQPTDPIALFLADALKSVAPRNKIRCIREMLEVIEKY